ncbi:UDP-glycosyltransferase 89C1-like isoform X1 [Camellia sinensis]|uniref:UDP-glycosyltransferase 89C1-like isoform X1 n=1 Tax=Camellia sinensis TaxID=4442 RepID=UPI001036170F|nr:UDP-glycosyltransferase 89C1-like isoform X1 [Camellia sinensis]
MLDLTHQLALRGITITILVTPKNLPILHPLLSTHHPSSIQTLVLPFPSHPSLPSGVENFTDIGNAGNLPMINALGQLHDPIIHWFKSHPSPPVAILSAFFLVKLQLHPIIGRLTPTTLFLPLLTHAVISRHRLEPQRQLQLHLAVTRRLIRLQYRLIRLRSIQALLYLPALTVHIRRRRRGCLRQVTQRRLVTRRPIPLTPRHNINQASLRLDNST